MSGSIVFIWVLSSYLVSEIQSEARSFTEDPFMTDEKFREKVPTKEILGVIDGKAEIPCDLTPPFPSDSPHLILFYKDVYGSPIYSFDMRSGENGHHWVDNNTLGSRAYFQFRETGGYSETGAPVIASFLGIEPLKISDRGAYRCRVDFREAPTKNTRIKLNLIVPPGPPVIYSHSEKTLIDGLTNPVREDSTLVLICETIGGDPLPRLTWWKDNVILDDVVEEIDAKTYKVRNILRLPNLKRSHHGSTLTCRASNTNLTNPVSSSVKINMVFPPVRAKIVREWSYFRAGQAYNVSCQVLGSRPSASTSIFVGPSQLREVNYQISPDGNVSTTTVIFIPGESDQDKFLSCRAENIELPSSAVEDQWKIDVHYPPKAKLYLKDSARKDEFVRVGNDVYLRCEVDANPMPHTIRWMYEGKPLKISRTKKDIFLTDDTLILKAVDENRSGNYNCLAENQVGKGSSNTLRLNVKWRPEGLKNCNAANQTLESLTIVCTPGFNGGLEQKFVLEIYDAKIATIVYNITSLEPTFYVRGLSSGTEYNVEIYAVNAKGHSEKTLFETFTLQPAEKQLAATTTDLTSNNPMRLFPIIGVLVAIVLLLVIFAVIIVIVIRKHREDSYNGSPASGGSMTSIATTANSTLRRREDCSESHYGSDVPNSPDVIPSGFMYDRVLRDNPNLFSADDDLNSTFYRPSSKVLRGECQYAELSFNQQRRIEDKETEEERRLLASKDENPIIYAKIDHNIQRHRRKPSGQTMHSHNCPLKSYESATLPHRSLPSALSSSSSSTTPHRSSTLKRVAFKDDYQDAKSPTLPLDNRSIIVDFNSGIEFTPVLSQDREGGVPIIQILPAPPPGYGNPSSEFSKDKQKSGGNRATKVDPPTVPSKLLKTTKDVESTL